MSREEVARAGLLKAALAGKTRHEQGCRTHAPLPTPRGWPMMAPMITARLGLVLVLLVGPLAADAQQPGKALLGSASSGVNRLSLISPASRPSRQRLRELGYVEGRNIVIQYRWAEGDYERLPGLAKELVGLNLDLIVAGGGPSSALAVKAATKTIPVVFLGGPAVDTGIVPSIARPGGNLTGFDVLGVDLDTKRLELLKEALPRVARVAVLWNPGSRTDTSAARTRGSRQPHVGCAASLLGSPAPGRDRHRLRSDGARARPMPCSCWPIRCSTVSGNELWTSQRGRASQQSTSGESSPRMGAS